MSNSSDHGHDSLEEVDPQYVTEPRVQMFASVDHMPNRTYGHIFEEDTRKESSLKGGLESQIDLLVTPLPEPYAKVEVAITGPLGLLGFGVATMFKSFVWAGIAEENTFMLAAVLGIVYGGLTQLLAGLWELYRGNTFVATACVNYGVFWLGIGLFDILQFTGSVTVDEMPWGYFLWSMIWMVHTLMLLACLRYTYRMLQLTYILSATLFLVLALANFYPLLWTIGGYIGIALGASAWYSGWAEIMNSIYGREVVPIWPCPKPPTKERLL